jgi:hypothetical protein
MFFLRERSFPKIWSAKVVVQMLERKIPRLVCKVFAKKRTKKAAATHFAQQPQDARKRSFFIQS